MTDKIMNHERIHLEQQKETLVVLFFVVYILNFIFNLFTFNPRPYREILFEKEAFGNEENPEYLKTRKFWAWIR